MLVYTNNAESSVGTILSDTATTLTLATGEGDYFPDISASDASWFPLTIIKADGTGYEIVKATERSGDDITIERGQENTPNALQFLIGDVVSLRMTKAAFNEFHKDGDSVYLEHINIATQVNVGNDPIELIQDNVSELFDGLRLTFKPAANNIGAVTIKVNDLAAVPLHLPEKVRTELISDDLNEDLFADIRYVLEDEVFILDSALLRRVFATETDSGAVEMVEGDGVFDKETDPVSTSGAPKVPSAKQVSEMIADFKSRIAIGYLPAAWTYRGDGSDGVGSSQNFFVPYRAYNYTDLSLPSEQSYSTTVEAGQSRGVPVIRAQGKVTLDGLLQLRQNTSCYPAICIGPSSAKDTLVSDSPVSYTPPVGERPNYIPNQSQIGDLSARHIDNAQLIGAILSGTPIHAFHGAQGFGNVDSTVDDRYVPGRQGLVIVCEECEITSDAEIYMPTVSTRISQVETTETYHVSSDQQHNNTCRGGGGLMIIVSESLTINGSSQWQLDSRENTTISFNSLKLTETDDNNQRLYLNAGQGQLFHINPMTGVCRRWL